MNKTDIEWCDYTWNPVTGCLHNCAYCYARRQVNRFKLHPGRDTTHVLDEAYRPNGQGRAQPYPWSFDPTFHKYRLGEPQKMKTPQVIFVSSMGDLFGDFIPAEWIDEVFASCERARQHRYLFLTKNPARYTWALKRYGKTSFNMWFGTTINTQKDVERVGWLPRYNGFVSIEPIFEPITFTDFYPEWVIIGAETGCNNPIVPKREWIESIMNDCTKREIPVFLKNSLAGVWGEPLIQQFPKGVFLYEEKKRPGNGRPTRPKP